MARIARTHRLVIGEFEFRQITRAIMVHSNAQRKLKGFGQCFAEWLMLWERGDLRALDQLDVRNAQLPQSGEDHIVFLSFSAASSGLLRRWRDALQLARDTRTTVSDCIIILVRLYLSGFKADQDSIAIRS